MGRGLTHLASCVALAGCAPEPAEPVHGVLLMTVDSLRRDHVSAYGYRSPHGAREATTPAFDRIASDGALFLDARSSTSWTLPSHASLLTGLPDPLHGAVDNKKSLPGDLVQLPELFADEGFRTGGSFAGPNLHPAFGFDRGFERYEDCSGVALDEDLFENAEQAAPGAFLGVHSASHETVTSPLTFEAALRFFQERATDGAPFFYFAHWWDVHYDYTAPAEYVRRFTDPTYSGAFRGHHGTEKRWTAGPKDVAHLLALYDSEIRYTDDWIGRLRDELERLDLLDDTAVCVTSDHGEEFYEHGRWGHQRTLYSEVLEIPMALAAPGRIPAGTRVEGAVQLQDLYRTLALLAGLETPEYVDGRDLSGWWAGDRPHARPAYAYLEVPLREVRLSSWTAGRYKAIYDHRAASAALYDLERDPRERSARAGEEATGDAAAALAGLFSELQRIESLRSGRARWRQRGRQRSVGGPVDSARARRLRRPMTGPAPNRTRAGAARHRSRVTATA